MYLIVILTQNSEKSNIRLETGEKVVNFHYFNQDYIVLVSEKK